MLQVRHWVATLAAITLAYTTGQCIDFSSHGITSVEGIGGSHLVLQAYGESTTTYTCDNSNGAWARPNMEADIFYCTANFTNTDN